MRPDFIGIGVPKAATTWTTRCLDEHPAIRAMRQIHFFSREGRYRRGWSWYESMLPDRTGGELVGELSPSYLSARAAPARIRADVPEAKLLVCLRNPIERAHSGYWHARRSKLRASIYRSFREALERDPQILDEGFYHAHLQRYLAHFPRARTEVLIQEDAASDPLGFLRQLYRFLGVEPVDFEPPSARRSVNAARQRPVVEERIPFVGPTLFRARELLRRTPLGPPVEALADRTGAREALATLLAKNRRRRARRVGAQPPPMDPADRRYLREAYAEDIRRLEGLLGRDLSFWR